MVHTHQQVYTLESAGYGDFDRIIISGISRNLPRTSGGSLQLQRTGPFVPPMSLPARDIIVTADFLSVLSNSEFDVNKVVVVEKQLIVHSEWNGVEPPVVYSDVGQPEDCILSGIHNKEDADSLGELYEVVLPVGCEAVNMRSVPPDYESKVVQFTSEPHGDLFTTQLPGGMVPMCSLRFLQWMRTQPAAFKWIKFCPTMCIPAS